MNVLRRKMPTEKINESTVQRGIMLFAILLAWSAIVLNAPVLSFTSICSPIFGMVGCLILHGWSIKCQHCINIKACRW